MENDFDYVQDLAIFLLEKVEKRHQNQTFQDSSKVKFPDQPLSLGGRIIYEIRDQLFFTRYSQDLDKLLNIDLPKAQELYPELFGTGNSDDIVKALYKVVQHLPPNDIDAFEEYYFRRQSVWVTDYNRKKVLKLDLYKNRYIQEDKKRTKRISRWPTSYFQAFF